MSDITGLGINPGSNNPAPADVVEFEPPTLFRVYAIVFRVCGVLYFIGQVIRSMLTDTIGLILVFGIPVGWLLWSIGTDLVNGRERAVTKIYVFLAILLPLLFAMLFLAKSALWSAIVSGLILGVFVPPLIGLYRRRSALK